LPISLPITKGTYDEKCFLAACCLLLAVCFLAGCASNLIEPINVLDTKIINYPELGVISTKNIGDRLVAKGVRTTGPSLRITKAAQFDFFNLVGCAYTVSPGEYFQIGILNDKATDKKAAKTFDCFGPAIYKMTSSDGKSNGNCGGSINSGNICTDSKEYFLYGFNYHRAPLNQGFNRVKLTEKTIEGEPNFVQELIYNGRTGNQVKFVYREFSSDMIRAAFSQEVQYDLSQSPIIGFKALRMEVISADNTQISYRLIKNFD